MGTRSEPVENMDHPAAGNESVQENGEVIKNKHGIHKPLKDTGQADDDDMEETPEDVDDEEVKQDIEIRSVSLVSISEGSSEDYQMKDIKKLQIEQTCNECDAFPDNNYKLSSHLNTDHGEVILQHK